MITTSARTPDGYTEVGMMFLGTYVTPSRCVSINKSNTPEEFTELPQAVNGGHFPIYRARRAVWDLEAGELETADVSLYDSLFLAEAGGEGFLFCFDNSTPSQETVYCFHTGYKKQFEAGNYWTFRFVLKESLQRGRHRPVPR